jgi:hypothetical protein
VLPEVVDREIVLPGLVVGQNSIQPVEATKRSRSAAPIMAARYDQHVAPATDLKMTACRIARLAATVARAQSTL